MDVIPIADEILMLADQHFDVEVAIRAAITASLAFSLDADLLAVIDTSRDLDIEVFMDPFIASPAAGRAFVLDDFARAPAMVAGGLGLHHPEDGALLLGDGPPASAIGAGFDVGARLGA